MKDITKLIGNLEYKIFDGEDYASGLKACKDEGYRALFVPEIATLRRYFDPKSEINTTSFYTPSVRIVGMKDDERFGLYVHKDHFLSEPQNIIDTKKNMYRGQAGYQGRILFPNQEFKELLGKNDEKDIYKMTNEQLAYAIKKGGHQYMHARLGGWKTFEEYVNYLQSNGKEVTSDYRGLKEKQTYGTKDTYALPLEINGVDHGYFGIVEVKPYHDGWNKNDFTFLGVKQDTPRIEDKDWNILNPKYFF